MSEFKFECPHCQQHLQCNEEHSGRQIQCPKCQHLIVIPPAPGKTAQFDPQSGMTWATFVGSGGAKPGGDTAGPAKPGPVKSPKDDQAPPLS